MHVAGRKYGQQAGQGHGHADEGRGYHESSPQPRPASASDPALGCQGTFVAANNVVSQSVPHLHLHVVPRTKGDGLRGFFWPRTKYADDEEAAGYARRIREAL